LAMLCACRLVVAASREHMNEELEYAVLHEFVGPARRNLSPGSWDYLMGGAETETTLERNRRALDSLAFRPRVLRNVEKVSARANVFGQDLRLPVILAPIGSLQDFSPGGGMGPTKAAAEFGALHMLSSACAPGLETVAECVDYPKIYQLYVRGDTAWVEDHIARAMASKYIALCLTVDLDYYGRRERDLAKRYLTTSRRSNPADHFQARFSWADVAKLKSKFKIPFILKGIATAEDAKIAIEHGIEGIYVSNHGGRQLDHAQGSVSVLPQVVEAVGGKAQVIVDGGVMRGTDIVKAIALGANAVGVGRLQGLALGAGGQAAVVRMLELLEDEVIRCLGLLGVTSFAELNRSHIAAEPPLGRLWLDSAFPLLKDGY
jgi:isopentenyl diphosphate isomerase/L-lactate dehydrogenase-like FMN-dependent dehydrogenase